MTTYDIDPSRRVISVADIRLNRKLINDPVACATISEYASSTGIETGTVIELLGEYLDDGTLELEFVGDEIFLHTAPRGRPGPPHLAQVPANLWERLRDVAPADFAYGLWKLIRGLESGGWKVETQHARIVSGLARLQERPFLGVWVGGLVVPTLVFPTADELSSQDGKLSEYERAGASALAVVCDNGALDSTITAVRRWILARRLAPSLTALVLEAPRFNPTVVSPQDAAVTPRSVDGIING